MLNQALQFILDTLVGLFIYALLLRFYMQLLRSPYGNPVTQFLVALTDKVVKPARRVIPGLFGLDLATLFLAWMFALLLTLTLYWLHDFPFLLVGTSAYFGFALMALIMLVEKSIYLLITVQLLLFALSLLSPHSPYMAIVSTLSRPFTRLVQKYIPPIGNIDLSPMVIVLFCQLMLMIPVTWLNALAKTML